MGWLRKLFGEQLYIDCPRCLQEITVQEAQLEPNTPVPCPQCKFEIPPKYVKEFKNAYPVYIQLFGWSQVGKTMFLDVLRLMLYWHPLWEGFYCDPIRKQDFDHRAILLDQRRNGQIPKSTVVRDRNQNEPYIMLLNKMHRWQSRFLVMMDHAGEQFQDRAVPKGEIPFLQHCPTTIMLYSLGETRPGRNIEDLMGTYITSLEEYGVNFKNTPRKLVVAFSKGDKVTNIPPNLAHYLNTDESWIHLEQLRRPSYLQGAALSEYIEVMTRVSNSLQDWFYHNVHGGQAFLAKARDYGIETRFALISSQGQEFTDGTGAAQLSPKRVLDPFFFALDFQSK